MYNAECRSPHGQTPANDLANTPDHLRQGFQGQPRQYDPKDFGLTGNEEWRDPRFFRNMTYDTDAEAMEALQQRCQPMRTRYCPPPQAPHLSGLPEECLADVSAPAFDMSTPSQISGTSGEHSPNSTLPNICDVETPMAGSEATNYVNSLYREIVHRFESLRERIARGDNILPSEANQASTTSESAPQYSTQQPNNSVQTTLRKVTTHHDLSGNVTSRVEETSTTTNAPCRQLVNMNSTPINPSGGQGRQLNYSMPTEENIANISMPSYHEASMPAMSTRVAPQGLPSECLVDVSAPFLSDVSGQCRPSFGTDICLDDISAPSYLNGNSYRPRSNATQDINEISAPTFASSNMEELNTTPTVQSVIMGASGDSNREETPQASELLENVSMPLTDNLSEWQHSQEDSAPCNCLDDITPPVFATDLSQGSTPQRRPISLPSQNIQDISAPSLEASSHGPVTYELSKNINIPCNESSASARQQQRSMPSGNICDTSAPAYYMSGRSECLDNVTMPSFGGISGSTRRQQSMPSECLEDVSAPSMARSLSRGRPEQLERQNRMMTSQNIADISAPSFANSGNRTMTNEFLENVTPPTFGDVSREAGFMSNECPPTFGHSTMRSRAARCQSRSMTPQNISNITAPSYATSSRGMQETCEFLEDVSMPTFGDVSALRSPPQQPNGDRRQQTVPYECLEDISAPSLGRSMSRGQSRRKQDMTMPSQNISEISAPSFNYTGTSNNANRQGTMPSECLNDVSAPSFVQSTPHTRTPRRQQRSMVSQNICDISAPSFGSTGRGPFMDEYLDDVTMPSYGQATGSNRVRTPTRQQRSMPVQNIFDTSAPTYKSPGRGTRNDTCIENITMPSYVNSSRGASTDRCYNKDNLPSFEGFSDGLRRNQQLMASQNIYDISAPTFGSSGRANLTDECLENVTMPSFGGVTGSSRRQQSMPTECLNDVSAPSFATSMSRGASNRQQNNTLGASSYGGMKSRPMTSECLDNVTMPSFGGVSGARQDMCTPRENSNRGPTAQSTLLRRQQRSMPSKNICDISAPSFALSSRGTGRLEDISMPSYGVPSSAMSANTPTRQNPSMSSRNMCNNSAPSFAGNGRREMTNTRLEDISMPSYGSSGRPDASTGYWRERRMAAYGTVLSDAAKARCQPQMMPAQNSHDASAPRRTNFECLDSITMPSYYDVSDASNRSREQSQRRLQRSNAVRSTYQFTNVPQSSECLEDITMPSFGDTSRVVPNRGLTLPSQVLEDETAPSFALSVSLGQTQNSQQLWDISAPAFETVSSLGSYPRRAQPVSGYPDECLNDVTAPSFGSNTRSLQQYPHHMTSDFIDDVSMPNMQQGSPLIRARSFPCVSREQQIEDISDLCMGSPMHGISYSFNDSKSTQRRQLDHSSRNGYDPCSNYSQQNRSEASRQRSRSLPWPEGHKVSPRNYQDNTARNYQDNTPRNYQNNRFLPSENLENITEPSMFDKSSRGVNGLNGSRCRTQEQLEDVSMPTMESTGQESRNTFGTSRSTRIEDVSTPSGFESQYSTAQSQRTPNESFELRGVMNTKNIEDESMPSNVGKDSTSASKKTKSKLAKCKKQEVRRTSVGFDNNAEQSQTGNGLPESSRVVKETHEISLKTSITSVEHSFRDKQLNESDRIEDISPPQFESTGNDATPQFLSDICEPTLPSSYQSTQQSQMATDASCPCQSESFHGFDSMPNYAPFDNLVNATQDTTDSKSGQSPQPLRKGTSRSMNASSSQRCELQRRSNPNKKQTNVRGNPKGRSVNQFH